MRIPHTIPKIVLKAYARNLNEEELLKSYEGRLLRSEDATWDAKIQPTLRDSCLERVTEQYVFYVKLVEDLNRQKLEGHEKNREQWGKDLANYLERKASYEKKKAEHEEALAQRLIYGDLGDDDDDDDDGDQRPGLKKGLQEPEEVPDKFSEFEPIKNVLDQMWDEDRVQAIEELDIDYIPFEIAVLTIPDDYYWERMSQDRWPHLHDCDDHGKKWRRMYLERNVWEAIETFHPIESDIDELQTIVDLVSSEIIEIRLNNLIPACFGTPRKTIEDKIPDADFIPAGTEEDQGFGDGEENDHDLKLLAIQQEKDQKEEARRKKRLEKAKEKAELEGTPIPPDEEPDRTVSDHIDFGFVLPKFINLKVLSLIYELQDQALDWEERLFKFTDVDCLNLAKALSQTPSLETFELLRSHVNDEQCKTLIREGLIKMPHLRKINLSYNRISDAGARAIARLLTDDSSRAIHTIHTVLLARNKIHNRGGKALAWALSKNNHLSILDLRLNRMGDPAGRDFGHALAKNHGLLVLLLGANRISESTAYVMNKMLFHNNTLKELDLSSNDLGKKGGEHIALGIRANTGILRNDVRLCNIGLDFEYDIGTHLRKNRNKLAGQYTLIDRDDYQPNDVESGLLDLNEPEWSDEEEEHEHEDGKMDEDEEEEEEGEDDEDEEEEEHIEFVKAPGSLDMSKTIL